MEEKKILSLIIPTYNMEKYLHHCLSSLIVPEEQMKQLEVLVINDGSKDSSSAIAHEYQDKYPETFRVIDKENGNYGSCVNRGLKEAVGKYVKVLDADDWFDTEALKQYLAFLSQEDADLIFNYCLTVDSEDNITGKFEVDGLSHGCHLSFEEFVQLKHYPQMHNVAYKMEVVREMNYRQTEGISYTDMEWVAMPMANVQSLALCGVYLYHYLVGREGQTVSSSVVNKSFRQHCQVALSLIDFATRYQGDIIHKEYLIGKAANYLRLLYRKHIAEGYFLKQEFRAFDMQIKKKYPAFFKTVSGWLCDNLYISLWRNDFLGIITPLMRLVGSVKQIR